MMRRNSAIGAQRSDSSTLRRTATARSLAAGSAVRAASCTIACAIFSIMLRFAVGRIRPGMPTRSPPCTSTSARAKDTTNARSSLLHSVRAEVNVHRRRAVGPEPHRCARLPIRAREHRDDRRAPSGANRRCCAGSPDTKRRYCQKFSPGPARRRPCSPWMTVEATRRASRMSRGIAPRACGLADSGLSNRSGLDVARLEFRHSTIRCAPSAAE